ncbi:MAG: tRNA (adenosine(37)-N6)-threonylcarbamoyltransferase complex ATPase subunit type 1 TsaE [Ruminococcaceae bacterium]|nr:tRNA (adenosine(37)-N6)-threonylcarbamoyltransferase complex ATPase subunit type 1 TsaE [Oscillospiraceae bacterium]
MTLLGTHLSLCPEDTERLGESVGQWLSKDSTLPRFIALYGDLGVGKTALVRGLARAIAPKALVRSPTFALVNEYRASPLSLFHFDMYRIADEDDLYSIGFYDYLCRKGICVVEWSENIPYALPTDYLRIELKKTEEECERIITVDRIKSN